MYICVCAAAVNFISNYGVIDNDLHILWWWPYTIEMEIFVDGYYICEDNFVTQFAILSDEISFRSAKYDFVKLIV